MELQQKFNFKPVSWTVCVWGKEGESLRKGEKLWEGLSKSQLFLPTFKNAQEDFYLR